jgi:very-short-patch-repair endonuclease
MPSDESSTKARLRARRLRRNTTDAEKRLWYRLRKLDLDGSHFRRQVPIGPYIADFACMAARLVIEVDGSQHANDYIVAHDERRTRWLMKEGYRVLRFWNNDLARNMDGIMETVYAALYGSMAAPPVPLKHRRRARVAAADLPTLARDARRPSPCRGGNNA